ncbi:MAG: hypothetical protein IJ071_10550 [Ruminococcus sp.]|nr:hypothetical protein [Ruminococcus sp.]
MKLQKLWALLKASKYIIKWKGTDAEWLSDGYAAYPVYGLPELSEDMLRTMLDVDEDKWSGYRYREEAEPPFSDEDNFRDDEELRVSQVTFTVHGVEYIALTQGLDIYLIRCKELKPLDSSEGLGFYLRDGYVAVKEGMILRAVILPEIITDDTILAEIMSIATKLRDRASEHAREVYREEYDDQQIFEDVEEDEE